jgi:hypothetical protein
LEQIEAAKFERLKLLRGGNNSSLEEELVESKRKAIEYEKRIRECEHREKELIKTNAEIEANILNQYAEIEHLKKYKNAIASMISNIDTTEKMLIKYSKFTCAICQEDSSEILPNVMLQCMHKFHYNCILKQYLCSNGGSTCPQCRKPI